jgi:hypothetical protein
LTDEAIFSDISRTIGRALEKVYEVHPRPTGIAEAALRIALEELIPEEGDPVV